MLAALARRDFSGVTEADVRFHELIADASENHALERAFDQLAPFARTFITLTLPGVDVHEILLQHRPILEALRAHDADRAAAAARAHQLAVAELLSTHLPVVADDGSSPERRRSSIIDNS
jgi:DNA-binding GntR family transcriptional regulator